MRVLFLFLLIVNGLMGGWFYLQPVKNDLAIKPVAENINSLVLLNEVGAQKESDKSTETAAPAKVKAGLSEKKESAGLCFTLGPFKDEIILKQARKQLAEQVQNINVRKREESQRHRYWVYLPALSSRGRAIEQSKQLAQIKINDYYIVHNGEKKNAISLGHFREKKHADHRIKQLKKQGFDAEMEVIFRRIDVFWLDYSVKENNALNDGLISNYLIDGVTRLDRSCN